MFFISVYNFTFNSAVEWTDIKNFIISPCVCRRDILWISLPVSSFFFQIWIESTSILSSYKNIFRLGIKRENIVIYMQNRTNLMLNTREWNAHSIEQFLRLWPHIALSILHIEYMLRVGNGSCHSHCVIVNETWHSMNALLQKQMHIILFKWFFFSGCILIFHFIEWYCRSNDRQNVFKWNKL